MSAFLPLRADYLGRARALRERQHAEVQAGLWRGASPVRRLSPEEIAAYESELRERDKPRGPAWTTPMPGAQQAPEPTPERQEEQMQTLERARTNNDLCTPAWLLDLVRQVGPIGLDPCSNPWSIVFARVALDGGPGRDGLTADWVWFAGDEIVYVNPPYGRGHMPKWAEKIAVEATRGVEIIALVKSDHSTDWWRVLMAAADARCELDERVRFEGGRHGSGTFPSTVFYCGSRPFRFAEVFEHVGHVEILTRRVRALRGKL